MFSESAQDVAAAVLFAAEWGQRIAPQGTGHGAATLGPLGDAILLKTERMSGLAIDPVERVARVEAGVLSSEVVRAAAQHGLTPLTGSSPDVGVVGYTLGGGLSFLGRKHGLAANNVRAIELVTADGSLVRADHDREPDLFRALRGGGGSFGMGDADRPRFAPAATLRAASPVVASCAASRGLPDSRPPAPVAGRARGETEVRAA